MTGLDSFNAKFIVRLKNIIYTPLCSFFFIKMFLFLLSNHEFPDFIESAANIFFPAI